METNARKSIHPLTAIAAVSLTLFSLVGIGAITGLIPTSHSQNAELRQASAAEASAPPAAVAPTAASEANPAEKPPTHKTALRHAKTAQKTLTPAAQPAPVTVAQNYPPPGMALPPPPPNQPAPALEPAKPICRDCGVIESVRAVEKKGEASGAGAAVGGIAGGLLGRQTGNGRGRDVMTVLGAIGGALAGHEIEKNAKKLTLYEIDIRFDDGTSRLITQESPPPWREGDRVRVEGGVITASNG